MDDRLFHKTAGHSDKVNLLTDLEEIVWRTYICGGADDFGVMRFEAAPLRNAHDRLMKRGDRQIQRMLERVAEVGLIQTFEHQGRRYCFQTDWQRWQHVRYPCKTIHPAPPPEALALCCPHTRWLFRHHPGGAKLASWQASSVPTDSGTNSGNASGIDSGNASGESSGPQCASHARPLAISHEPVAISQKPEASAKPAARLAFGGDVLEVPRFLDDEFVKRLNGEYFDLTAFYVELDAKLKATGEPWDLRWIRDQFAAASPQPERPVYERPFTAAELEEARTWRRKMGGCGHTPRCEDRTTCVDRFIRERLRGERVPA